MWQGSRLRYEWPEAPMQVRKVTVYRIQSKQDRTQGAYDNLSILCNKRNKYPQPLPCEDIGIERDVMPHEFCGFDSAVKLLQWFGGAISDMLRGGLEIVALHDVTITAVGEYQVLFKWDN
jgi:hypothetical protein